MRRFYLCSSLTKKERAENKVTIVRGVPGSGKKYYVYEMEKDKEGEFALCDWNEYFVDKEGTYKFKGTELGEAELYSRMKYLEAISEKVKRIYIVGYFNKKWMYSDYEKLAKLSGYSVEIVDMECPDHKHLMHFNKRSTHKTPYSKSLKCYKNHEYVVDNIRQDPYIENFPGDSLPNYGSVTRSYLDKQLEDFKINKRSPECLIKTESDDEDGDVVDTREFSNVSIEFVEDYERDSVLSREFYTKYDMNSESSDEDEEYEMDGYVEDEEDESVDDVLEDVVEGDLGEEYEEDEEGWDEMDEVMNTDI